MDYEKLMHAGIRFISYRPRSEKEIRDYLEKKLKNAHTSAPLLIIKVIDRLRELGYVDDQKFATWWIEQRTGSKPKGARLIAYELKQKGIEIEVTIDEIALARKTIEKKKFKDKKHGIDYLLRRGFSRGTSSRAVDEAVNNL